MGGCFPAFAKVSVPDGTSPIRNIRVGELVLRPGGTKELISASVREVFESEEELIGLVTTHGATLTTADQLFRCYDGKDRKTQELMNQFVGYLLDNKEIGYVKVVAIIPKGIRSKVFHLHVDDPNLYFVDNFLVHNKGGGSSTTVQETKIPDELKPLYKQTANITAGLQRYRPIQRTATAQPFTDFVGSVAGSPGSFKNLRTAPKSQPIEQSRLGAPGGVQPRVGPEGFDIIPDQGGYWRQGPDGVGPYNIFVPNPTQPQAPSIPLSPEIGPDGRSPNAADFTGGSIIDEFLDPNALKVANLSRLQQLALSQIPTITDVPEAERSARENIALAPFIAGRRPGGEEGLLGEASNARARLQALYERLPTGGTLETSPALKAADDYFKQIIEPTVVNQQTLRGLGRGSALDNALAKAKATYLLPLVQEELGREERALTGGAGAAERGQVRLQDVLEAGLGRGERAITRQAEAVQAGIPQLQALGGTERAARLRQIEELQKGGELERSIAQQRNIEEQRDYLRRQAIAESAIFGPLNQFLPSALGQQATTTTKQGGGGGVFK